MSKKDALIKEIDEISERVRFWHNAILTLLTGLSGLFFGVSQEKIVVNIFTWGFGIIAVIVLIFGVHRLEQLNDERKQLIKQLEKER